MNNVPNFQEFYQNKTILITGSTGFVGKVFLEKILYEFPNIEKVYVIIRDSNDKTPENRFNSEIIKNKIFDRIRMREGIEYENYMKSKIEVIRGNLATEKFEDFKDGIKKKTFEEIINKVNIIVHIAATIQFNEDLDSAIKTNVYGTLNMIKIGKFCKRLKLFLHVSTAYVNFPNYMSQEEKVYPLELPNNEKILDFCERVIKIEEQDELKRIEQEYLTKLKFPNT
jgi:thioester reductase-like protein